MPPALPGARGGSGTAARPGLCHCCGRCRGARWRFLPAWCGGRRSSGSGGGSRLAAGDIRNPGSHYCWFSLPPAAQCKHQERSQCRQDQHRLHQSSYRFQNSRLDLSAIITNAPPRPSHRPFGPLPAVAGSVRGWRSFRNIVCQVFQQERKVPVRLQSAQFTSQRAQLSDQFRQLVVNARIDCLRCTGQSAVSVCSQCHDGPEVRQRAFRAGKPDVSASFHKGRSGCGMRRCPAPPIALPRDPGYREARVPRFPATPVRRRRWWRLRNTVRQTSSRSCVKV